MRSGRDSRCPLLSPPHTPPGAGPAQAGLLVLAWHQPGAWTGTSGRETDPVTTQRETCGSEHVCGPARVCAERRECARRAHPCVTCRGRAGQASAWCWVGLCKVAWVPTDDREAGPPPAAPALRSGAGPSAPPGASSVALAFLSLAVALPGSGGRSHSRLKGKEVAIGGQGHRPRAAKTRLGSPSRTTCGGPELQF